MQDYIKFYCLALISDDEDEEEDDSGEDEDAVDAADADDDDEDMKSMISTMQSILVEDEVVEGDFCDFIFLCSHII